MGKYKIGSAMRSFLLVSAAILWTGAWLTGFGAVHGSGKCPAVHQKAVAVFIGPSDRKLEGMKKDRGEDFSVIADDAMFYQSQAIEWLEKMDVPFCFTQEEKLEFRAAGGAGYAANRPCEGWCVVLWNGKDKPVWTHAVDIRSHEAYLNGANGRR